MVAKRKVKVMADPSPRRLAAADSRMLALSQRVPDDQFAVYVFGGAPDPDIFTQRLLGAARTVPELSCRIARLPGDLDRPYRLPTPLPGDAVIPVRDVTTWPGVLARLAELPSVDPTVLPWRLWVFTPTVGAPRAATPSAAGGPATVVVLQINHAMADGRLVAELARRLFTAEPGGAPAVAGPAALPSLAALRGVFGLPFRLVSVAALGFRAAVSGAVPTDRSVPATRLNRGPGEYRRLRTLTVDAASLRRYGTGVTVGVLVALAEALPAYLGRPGYSPQIELMVADGEKRRAANHFRNIGVDLRADLTDRSERAAAITAVIAAARAEAATPARRRQDRIDRLVPEPLARLGDAAADLSRTPPRVAGIAVVSSVNRGPADLAPSGLPVRATAGFPALSAAHGLTHGVHGIGETVTISVTAADTAMPDVDRYLRLLAAALDAH